MRSNILAFSLVALLAACGGSGTDQTASLPPTTVSAPASLSLRWVGANVGMAELAPTGLDYVRTDRGDLFDIAHAAGLNIFRVIDWMPPGIAVPTYSSNDWRLVRERAVATRISLVPVLSQLTGDLTSSTVEDRFVRACETKADMILGDAGFAGSPALAFVDIVNEPVLTGWSTDAFAKIASYIRAKYPGVWITVGGWGPLITSGGLLTTIVDESAPHLYSMNGTQFADMLPAQEANDVYSELQTVNAFSAGKPVIVEEFGSPDGLLAPNYETSTTSGTPDSQAQHTDAMLTGIATAIGSGVPVTGALQWIFYPAGGTSAWLDPSNAGSLIVPNGTGKPLKVMPAVSELCKATGGTCAGAQQLIATPPIQQ